jgi:predicted nucleotide-binding protein
VWPNYQYVAGKLLRQGIDDAASVLYSFPLLGESGPITRYYGDVWFERTAPGPADDSRIALSVGGLSNHPDGEEFALTFVAVLGVCAEKLINAPVDPVDVVEVALTESQAAEALPGFRQHALRRIGDLVSQEHPVGIWSITPGGPDVPWKVGTRREVARYANLTIEKYLDLVRGDTASPGLAALPEPATLLEPVMNRRSVFVVHGRNGALRKSMFDFLRSIDLSPIEWTDAIAMTGSGSPYIGDVLDAAFDHAQAVVVLMTPDEVAYLQPQYGSGEGDPETSPSAQARPNVLFEAGMALGRDATRTVLVEVGQVRPFSDIAGRHAIRLTNAASSRQALALRLQTAGCDVSLTGTDWHTSGDFTRRGGRDGLVTCGSNRAHSGRGQVSHGRRLCAKSLPGRERQRRLRPHHHRRDRVWPDLYTRRFHGP